VIRVVVADDHDLVRGSICALLQRAGDIEIVGQATDGQEAVELVHRLQPDFLVMDLSMPVLNGIEATEQVRCMNVDTKVIILSAHEEAMLVSRARECGAYGYVLKRAIVQQLVDVIRTAWGGEECHELETSDDSKTRAGD